MNALLRNAADLLQTARHAVAAGHLPCDMVVLTGMPGGVRMIADSDWSLPALQAEYGASAAYRVSTRAGSVHVEARGSGESYRINSWISSDTPAHAAKTLLGANVYGSGIAHLPRPVLLLD